MKYREDDAFHHMDEVLNLLCHIVEEDPPDQINSIYPDSLLDKLNRARKSNHTVLHIHGFEDAYLDFEEVKDNILEVIRMMCAGIDVYITFNPKSDEDYLKLSKLDFAVGCFITYLVNAHPPDRLVLGRVRIESESEQFSSLLKLQDEYGSMISDVIKYLKSDDFKFHLTIDKILSNVYNLYDLMPFKFMSYAYTDDGFLHFTGSMFNYDLGQKGIEGLAILSHKFSCANELLDLFLQHNRMNGGYIQNKKYFKERLEVFSNKRTRITKSRNSISNSLNKRGLDLLDLFVEIAKDDNETIKMCMETQRWTKLYQKNI
ncbi:MAG: hypothetical protein CL489_16580 [Acidobacteria bacterium]|nr:hypothetical protein [Acidobacteriota bacterium]|tara:strand:- start:2241 stop:3191 length:951 start_codon:yes stop_codon:yes gene_type:complete